MLTIKFRPQPEDLAEIQRRTEALVGQPFIELSSEAHKVAFVDLSQEGEATSGRKVRYADLQQLLNDRLLMDAIYANAKGYEKRDTDARLQRWFEKALELASADPVIAEKVERLRAFKCIVCGEPLLNRIHQDGCSAGEHQLAHLIKKAGGMKQ